MSASQIRPHWLLWAAAISVHSPRAHFPLQWQIINWESRVFKVFKEQLGGKKWTQQDAGGVTSARSPHKKAGLLQRAFESKLLVPLERKAERDRAVSQPHSCVLYKHPPTGPPFSSSAVLFFLMSGLNSSRWLFHTANRIRPRGQIATWSAVEGGGGT